MAIGWGRYRISSDVRTVTGIILVLVILAVADVAANRTALKFLLLPPFGALTYLIFVNPARIEMNARRIIVAPCLTAVWAWLIASTLAYHAPAVVLAALGTMAIMWVLRAHMVVPPMALALLTLLLHDEVRWHVDYLISVFLFTIAIYAIYAIWNHLTARGSQPQQDGRLPP